MTKDKKLKPTDISHEQARSLLAEPGWKEAPELAPLRRRPVSWRFYRHADGRVLLVDFDCQETPAVLHPNDAWILEAREKEKLLLEGKIPKTISVVAGRLPQGQDFPQHVDGLINQLVQELGIGKDKLDGSIASARMLDEILEDRDGEELIESVLFPLLIAYVGDVVIKSTGSRWEMLRNRDDKSWEPTIVSDKGTRWLVADIVYDSLRKKKRIESQLLIAIQRLGGREGSR